MKSITLICVDSEGRRMVLLAEGDFRWIALREEHGVAAPTFKPSALEHFEYQDTALGHRTGYLVS